jgi:hypothetical protein
VKAAGKPDRQYSITSAGMKINSQQNSGALCESVVLLVAQILIF